MKRISLYLGITVSALTIAGCATYHALPLPAQANLSDSLDQIRHSVPEVNGGSTEIDVTRPLTVDQIGLLAMLNAPQLANERGQMEAAQANVIQGAILPNPSVSLGWAALLGGPGTTSAFTASLAQDVASLVTYRRRKAAANDQVEQVNADLLWQEWQVAQKARLLAIDLYWGAQAIRATEAQLAQVASTADAVHEAVDAGNLDYSALSPLRDTQASTSALLETLRETQLNNWHALDALLGVRPGVRVEIAAPRIAMPAGDIGTQTASVQDRRPDLIALQLGYRAADDTLRAAILGQFPALVLGGSWSSDTSDVRSAGPTATFDLPIFNRNQGPVVQAHASRLLLREQYQQQLDDTVSTVHGLYAQDQRIEAALAEARQARDSAAALAAAARTAFQQRNIDQRTLTDFVSIAQQREVDLVNLERARDEARIGLTLELGIGLPTTRVAPLDPENAL